MPNPDERRAPDQVGPQDLETAGPSTEQPHPDSPVVTQHQSTQTSATVASGADLASRLFGDYEILDEIARGGMGVVYRARQISLKRTVALKKILSGQLARADDLKRFQIEAEAAAQLDHPGIVPVYDFGQVDGQYYFSMAYIEGDDLAKRIRERPMEPEASAAMMIKIAQAVGYANAQGVIHRDLKPSNVLLDQAGEPKVTDFGVAKQQTNDSELTVQGQILGTPSYMPPEQAAGSGEQVDQRSDVYALGAILYALLTCRPPFQAATALETVSQVLEQEPVPISQMNASIPRDLETICLKCLQKDPAKRYVSADALAEDLRRYLSDEPILARPPTRLEQLGRWVRKNKTTAISTAVVAAALIIATVVSINFAIETGRQRDEADDQRTIAEAKADVAQETLKFLNNDLLGEETLREMRRQGKGEYMSKLLDEAANKLEGKFGEQPEVEAKVRQTLGNSYRILGEQKKAFPHLERALALQRELLGDDHPATLNLIHDLGYLLKQQGKLDEAESLLREAMEGRRRQLGDEHPVTLLSINHMGLLLHYQNRLDEAEPLYREALDGRRRVLGNDQVGTLTSIHNMGTLRSSQGRWRQAEPLYREALKGQRRLLGDDHEYTMRSINNLGLCLKRLGKTNEAETLYREVLDLKRRVLGDKHWETLVSITNMGTLLMAQDKLEEAELHLREAVAGCRDKLGIEHQHTLTSISHLGKLLYKKEKFDEAETCYREALQGQRRLLGDEHAYTLASLTAVGKLLCEQGKYDKAESFYREALEVRRRTLGDEHPQTLVSQRSLADLLAAQKAATEKQDDRKKEDPQSDDKR